MVVLYDKKLNIFARMNRRAGVLSEVLLWNELKQSALGVKFTKQKPIGNYIADFYCHKARLVIELDGSQHYTKDGILKDKIRTEKIEKRDLTVLRIPNGEINHNFEGICRFIDEFAKESLRQPSADTSL